MFSEVALKEMIKYASLGAVAMGLIALLGYVLKRVFDREDARGKEIKACSDKKETVENGIKQILEISEQQREAQSISTHKICERLLDIEKNVK